MHKLFLSFLLPFLLCLQVIASIDSDTDDISTEEIFKQDPYLSCPTLEVVNNIPGPMTITDAGVEWIATFKSQKNDPARNQKPPANPDTMLNTKVTRLARVQVDQAYANLVLIYENDDGSVQKRLQLSGSIGENFTRRRITFNCQPDRPYIKFIREVGDSGKLDAPNLYFIVPSDSNSFPDGMILNCGKPSE